MSKAIVFSIVESPTHPKLSALYEELGYQEIVLSSMRKAIAALKKYKPDVIVAEFFYAYGSNYASNHICNLDTLLITLQTYPDYHPKILMVVKKAEQEFVSKLGEHYGDYYNKDYVLVQPVYEQQVRDILLAPQPG